MKGAVIDWVMNIINSLQREGMLPSHLNETLIQPIIKCPQLASNNFRPFTNISFLGKVIKRAVANQLQTYLEEQDCLDPFQSGFRLQLGTETTLVVLQMTF